MAGFIVILTWSHDCLHCPILRETLDFDGKWNPENHLRNPVCLVILLGTRVKVLTYTVDDKIYKLKHHEKLYKLITRIGSGVPWFEKQKLTSHVSRVCRSSLSMISSISSQAFWLEKTAAKGYVCSMNHVAPGDSTYGGRSTK